MGKQNIKFNFVFLGQSIDNSQGETPQDIRKAMEDYIPIDLDEV